MPRVARPRSTATNFIFMAPTDGSGVGNWGGNVDKRDKRRVSEWSLL